MLLLYHLVILNKVDKVVSCNRSISALFAEQNSIQINGRWSRGGRQEHIDQINGFVDFPLRNKDVRSNPTALIPLSAD